jgi:transcription elongation factor SPT6
VDDIFSDDEEDADRFDRRPAGGLPDDLDDFIEEDEIDDEVDRQLREELEVAKPGTRLPIIGVEESGLDEASWEDYQAAFGDGTEYDWALAKQQDMDEDEQGNRDELQLKDVFEPSQLVERMLTDEDNDIRMKDSPERFQIARKPFKELDLSPEEMSTRLREEATWISNLTFAKKRFPQRYLESFIQATMKVLEYLNVEELEVPFIWHQRRDYLIAQNLPADDFEEDDEAAQTERLLTSNDLWEIFELDLKFRAFAEKRDALRKLHNSLREMAGIEDTLFEELLPQAANMEEVQDIHDYLHFQYQAQLKELALMEAETHGTQKRAHAAGRNFFEHLRTSKAYNLVRAIGISADKFAENVSAPSRRNYTDDPSEFPEDLADSLADPPDFITGSQVLRACKTMFVEEIVHNPRIRKHFRAAFYAQGLLDCVRTASGLIRITEDHPYYEFKYLRNQDARLLLSRPDLFLKMLKAESEGLIELKFKYSNASSIREKLHSQIESDNVSEVADAWNKLRHELVDAAMTKLEKIVIKGVRDTIRSECESRIGMTCRERYSKKLDQGPYKPVGMVFGTTPRVLALSNGHGVRGRDAICWAWVEHDGRVLENGKFSELRLGNPEKYIPESKDVAEFVELCQRRKPDVIAVSGFSTEARKLYKDIQDIIEKVNLRGPEYQEDDEYKTERLDVILANDEVARLYQNSDRAAFEFPQFPPLTKYCIALARYVQNPLKEYASLGKDITSITVDQNQNLIPKDKLLRYFESAMVDIVNVTGVDINEAVSDPSLQNLLPFVCGLGPRKASQLLKAININGGVVGTRFELLGDPDKKLVPAVGPKVFTNMASFIYLEPDENDAESEPLDGTRIHPEDYEIARKMAADALGKDEEDIKAEQEEWGPSAMVRRLIKDEETDKVNDLVIEDYAKQLEQRFGQRKRATLEQIREELQQGYEELRDKFKRLSTDEIFTMLTGETPETLKEGMVVPVTIRRTFPDHVECRLECGIEAGVSESEFPEGVGGAGASPRSVWQPGQVVQSKIIFLNRKALTAQVSLREDIIKQPRPKQFDHGPSEWDEAQEQLDKRGEEKKKEVVAGRTNRVVKHPLFHPFNTTKAEEFLGSKEPGTVVIRPSSKGPHHLAITWKVADGVYQHLDVTEYEKENEFSLGRTLKVNNMDKYKYTDLDELIASHIEGMAKKVTEMMRDERFREGSKAQVGM